MHQRTPSYLLDAFRSVVPFKPRPEEFLLEQWRDATDGRASVLLLCGPGGQGKTRLAGKFASQSHEIGWEVAQAVEKNISLRGAPYHARVQVGSADRPLLVVVDYAERWSVSNLGQLISSLPLEYPDRAAIRFLLLSRSESPLWDTLSAELDRSGVELPNPIPLGALASPGPRRHQAFNEAVTAFQGALEVAQGRIDPPNDLDSPEYGSPLTLHMAALAAVCARRDSDDRPAREDLSTFLLRHERRYWAASSLPIELIERVVFLATALGPVTDPDDARSVLRSSQLADGDAQANSILWMHRSLYPDGAAFDSPTEDLRDSGAYFQHGFLNPLRPDRFGEDFIAQLLGKPGILRWLRGLLLELNQSPSNFTSTVVRNCLAVISMAAMRHESAQEALFILLGECPSLVRHANDLVLRTVIDNAPYAVAEKVEDALPQHSLGNLRYACALAVRLVNELPSGAPVRTRVARLYQAAGRLLEVGEHDAAREVVEHAISIMGDSADTLHDSALDLARCLNILSIVLRESDRERSKEAADRAVTILRNAAGVGSVEWRSALVNCLISLAAARARDDDLDGALRAAEEAVKCCEVLASSDPDKFIPRLATSLHAVSVIAHQAGALSDAEAAGNLSMQVFDALAVREPGIYILDLIRSLRSLSSIQAETNSLDSALATSSRSVDLCRWLTNIDMFSYLPDLAESLRAHSALLLRSQDLEASWFAAVESVILLLWLDSLQPDKYITAIVRVMLHFKDVVEGRLDSGDGDDFQVAASGILLGISKLVRRTPFGFEVGDFQFSYERIDENNFSVTRTGPAVVSDSE